MVQLSDYLDLPNARAGEALFDRTLQGAANATPLPLRYDIEIEDETLHFPVEESVLKAEAA